MPYDKPQTIYPGDGQDSVKEAILKNDDNITFAYLALNELEFGQTGAEILRKLLDVDGTGTELDADKLDGKHADEFAEVVHSHEKTDITDLVADLDARPTMAEHIDSSAGPTDVGKPIKLNSAGQVDPSMIDVSSFHYVGPFTPASGAEYPDTTGETHGAFWVVQGLSGDYTFTGGDLAGEVVSNGDFMVWAAAGWSIMTSEMNPMLYYKLDGSQPITDHFQAGGYKLLQVGAGADPSDGINKGQMDAELALKLDADAQAVDSALLEGHPASDFAPADGAGYLPLTGGTLSGNLIVGDEEQFGSVGIKNNAPDGRSSVILRDDNGNPRGTFYAINDTGYVGFQRQAPDQSVSAEMNLEENGNVSILEPAPIDPQNLTRKDYVDAVDAKITGHEAATNPHGITPALIDALAVDGQAVDSALLEGESKAFFAEAVHDHEIDDIADLQDELDARYLKTDHIAVSAGSGDAGKPIILDGSGKVDPSMISIDSFHYVTEWNPSVGDEYPDPSGETPGAFWIISGIGGGLDYTFTGGDLAGETVVDGNFMVWGSAGWSLIKSDMNPQQYYKLDGTQAISADFAAGGFKLANIADGTENNHAASVYQLNSGLALKLDTGAKAANSLLFDDQNINYFAKKTDLDSYLPITGQAADSLLFNGEDADFYAKATDLSNYLPTSGTAANSYLLEGHGASFFAEAADLAGYLPIDGTAADSHLLGGAPATSYSLSSHLHDGVYLPIGGGTLTGNLSIAEDGPNFTLETLGTGLCQFVYTANGTKLWKFTVNPSDKNFNLTQQHPDDGAWLSEVIVLKSSTAPLPQLLCDGAWKVSGSQIHTDDYHPNVAPKATVSIDPPTGGVDGDVWYQI